MEFEELFSWLKSNTSASPFVLDRLCSVLVDMDLPGDVGVPDAAGRTGANTGIVVASSLSPEMSGCIAGRKQWGSTG